LVVALDKYCQITIISQTMTAPNHDVRGGPARVRRYRGRYSSCAPTMSQTAGLEAILHGERYVKEMVHEYDRRRKLLVHGLNALGLDCFEPQGAFYAFPSVAKSGLDDKQFSESLLLEERVAVVPGSAFGASGAGFVRMCYATAYEKIEQALLHMERFMRRHG
jgi:aminotransferase